MPYAGKQFIFTQPDGKHLPVRGWGNQYNAVFETLDGYTVTQDPVSKYYQYATASSDLEELIPSGIKPDAVNPKTIGIEPNLRIDLEAFKARSFERRGMPRGSSRWEIRRKQYKTDLLTAMTLESVGGILSAPPQRQTVGNYIGLCLLVEFPDVPATISQSQVSDFCNNTGYADFGNNGSVKDYFLDVSGGKLNYTNIVAPYYKTQFPREYYTNENIEQPKRARQLIKEALDHLKSSGFNFSQLTTDNQNYVYALNIFYAGPTVNNWAKGLWPHSYHLLTPYELMPGKLAYDYQITNIGTELTLGTFCHENGHMICDFPDLYDYGYESRGVGSFCLMCGGGNANEKNPAHVGAYLKYKAGWIDSLTALQAGNNMEIKSGANNFHIHKKSATEYFIIENRQKKLRDVSLPSAGIAVWHVDELGDNSNEQMLPNSHYECRLVQADGKDDLEKGVNNGDAKDLFSKTVNDKFNDGGSPHSKWWDHSVSGLNISQIGDSAETMKYST